MTPAAVPRGDARGRCLPCTRGRLVSMLAPSPRFLLTRSTLAMTVSLVQFADVREVFDGITWS
jgi:hypothetical protein